MGSSQKGVVKYRKDLRRSELIPIEWCPWPKSQWNVKTIWKKRERLGKGVGGGS